VGQLPGYNLEALQGASATRMGRCGPPSISGTHSR